ncbi:hypothetical protein ACNKHK_09345 [Shigella flexneri]
MTALALALGSLALLPGQLNREASHPYQLQQKQGAAIDTRQSAFYNGWPQSLNWSFRTRTFRLDLSAAWLDNEPEQLSASGSSTSVENRCASSAVR